MITVKIEASVHSMAKKAAVLSGQKMEDLLSDLLKEPLAKMLNGMLKMARSVMEPDLFDADE